MVSMTFFFLGEQITIKRDAIAPVTVSGVTKSFAAVLAAGQRPLADHGADVLRIDAAGLNALVPKNKKNESIMNNVEHLRKKKKKEPTGRTASSCCIDVRKALRPFRSDCGI